jgi:hypothetical protein
MWKHSNKGSIPHAIVTVRATYVITKFFAKTKPIWFCCTCNSQFGARKQKQSFLESKTVLFWPLFKTVFCEIWCTCSLLRTVSRHLWEFVRWPISRLAWCNDTNSSVETIKNTASEIRVLLAGNVTSLERRWEDSFSQTHPNSEMRTG